MHKQRALYSTPNIRGPSIQLKTDRFLHNRRTENPPTLDLSLNPSCSDFNSHLYSQITRASHSKFSPMSQEPFVNQTSLRKLPSQAERILDAPEIVDDYYLNLLDWSDNNTLAVALNNKLYLWHAESCSASQLLEYDQQMITSVSWMAGSSCIAVGDSANSLKLFDLEKSTEIRSISVHTDRVCSLAWNQSVLSSGSRDCSIVQHDMRMQSYFVKCQGHEQEVCGLRWNSEGTQLASGGNDNKMCLWELSYSSPQVQVNAHSAAVKALAWCPWQTHTLATGGGSADKQIKIWDTVSAECVRTVNTGSQVCALEWGRHNKEIVSAHGYSLNQLTLWNYPSFTKVGDFVGHTARVLCMTQNPQGTTVVTASADETLRFWNFFESASVQKEGSPGRPMGFCYR